MASYVSVRFETATLSDGRIRVIVRNLDEGAVPPVPSSTYYPTDPDLLQNFIVATYLGPFTGESFTRIASLADVTGTSPLELPLVGFSPSAVNPGGGDFFGGGTDFIASGVVPGDILQVTPLNPELWTSEKYTDTSTFSFTVSTVVSSAYLTVNQSFPMFETGLAWSIAARSLSGLAGITLRTETLVPPFEFKDKQFTFFFPNTLEAQQFITATQALLDALAKAGTAASIASSNYTGSNPP